GTFARVGPKSPPDAGDLRHKEDTPTAEWSSWNSYERTPTLNSVLSGVIRSSSSEAVVEADADAGGRRGGPIENDYYTSYGMFSAKTVSDGAASPSGDAAMVVTGLARERARTKHATSLCRRLWKRPTFEKLLAALWPFAATRR
ncbi:hypothetical protein BIW11_13798, partial [Tropilaelaps mercedesae]